MEATNKCQWCSKETDLPWSYYPMSPIIPEWEDKMLAENKNGKKWHEREDEIDPKLFDKLGFYDQLIYTVGKAYVCIECNEKEDKNYTKYHRNQHEENNI